MFVLKSLGKYLLGDANQSQIAEVSSGVLFVHKVNGASAVCKFKDASAAIRKAGTESWNYQLLISRIYEEGEKELESDDASDDELCFLVDECLLWSKVDDKRSFKWISDGNIYEFVVDSKTSNVSFDIFYLAFVQCAFERKFKRPRSEASEADLEALAQYMSNQMASKDMKGKKEERFGGEVVLSCDSADFYLYEAGINQFVPKFKNVSVSFLKVKSFCYSFNVTNEGKVIHFQDIDPAATIHIDKPTFSFIWCWQNGESIWTFSLRFLSLEHLLKFANFYGSCSYEILNKESFQKLDKDDADYVMKTVIEDTEMAEAYDSEENEESGFDSETEEEEEEEEELASPTKAKDGQRNTNLAVGYKHDRSFVSRGSSIGVFKHTNDDRLEFQTNIKNVSSLQGKTFTPSKMMLHEEDTSLLLMNPNENRKLFKMDLEYGKVIEEWEIDKNMNLTNIVPDSKYSQMTGTKTLIGLNENALFRIDPRLSGMKRVESETKEYLVKNGFTCGATTEQGELAVGSGKGDVRLYNKLDKRAKTLLPGFGDAIIGIDVSANGKWIIATCKTYLLLINAQIEGSEATGFTKSLGSKKPAPKRLQLKPEHVAYIGKEPSFTPAKFSTGGSEEKTIITSTGPYVITWDLKKVKQGKLGEYQIKKYYDDVVADNFKFGADKAIVVTLPDDVTMVAKKHLLPATPKSLRVSRNEIVNSPF